MPTIPAIQTAEAIMLISAFKPTKLEVARIIDARTGLPELLTVALLAQSLVDELDKQIQIDRNLTNKPLTPAEGEAVLTLLDDLREALEQAGTTTEHNQHHEEDQDTKTE